MLNVQRAFFLAAIIFFAGAAIPSLAHAHGGHAHATPAAARAGHVMAPHPITQHAAPKPSMVKLANADLQNRAVLVTKGCADHCCGGASGTSCCGTALPTQTCFVPFVETERRLVIRDMPALTGISPYALPKPPKSFA